MYWLLREYSGNTASQGKIWFLLARSENLMNQRQGRGDHHGLGPGWWGINWGLLSFWSLCFDWRGKKWTTLKLKRTHNIPRICRVRDKYLIHLSFREKVAPNMNWLGLEKASRSDLRGGVVFKVPALSSSPRGPELKSIPSSTSLLSWVPWFVQRMGNLQCSLLRRDLLPRYLLPSPARGEPRRGSARDQVSLPEHSAPGGLGCGAHPPGSHWLPSENWS